MQLTQLLALPVLLAGCTANALEYINHDAVRTIPESLPRGIVGANIKRFQPYFNTLGPGCWPYPAVDVDGRVSGGLKPSGPAGGQCSNSAGQAYVRHRKYQDHYIIGYAYYMPKDSDKTRHDWQVAYLKIDDINSSNPRLLGVAVSQGPRFGVSPAGPNDGLSYRDGHLLVNYITDATLGEHVLRVQNRAGSLHPAIDIDLVFPQVKSALLTGNWGRERFPLQDNFADVAGRLFR
ncbi:hypothetical protein E4U42_004161 [Claviceps africana]|uniref:Necrosis inducing protein (NPP1) n=1 Tax=Claviceps africana TaxID=83212 RepID=A0A8K0J8F4_9HYPO|nr:hypothetical protein E4U42_004161 [Claviceps africana]